jgi:hypothetical protein
MNPHSALRPTPSLTRQPDPPDLRQGPAKRKSQGGAMLCATLAFPRQRAKARCHKRWSRPVSRVLYVLRRDSHSSRPGVAAWLQRPTREQRGPRYRSPIRSCSGWGLPCRTTLAPYAVRSYRTLSPLPDPLARPSAVCSLLHWPSARAAQALPGTLPCGARTFLDALACDATVRPTPWVIVMERALGAAATAGLTLARVRTAPCVARR